MLLAIYLAVGALAIECKTSGNNCFAGQCDTVGGTEICMRCQTGRVPINGVCAEAANNDKCKDTNGSTDADQTCKKCLLETFMYKGGCYEIANSPGSIICSQKGAAGVCQTCNAANGYFTNPEAANNVDSCISCDDTTGVKVGSGDSAKTYKGVDGCKTCTISDSATTATCTECATGFLHTPSEGATSCVETCPEGYFGHTDSNTKKTCQSCSTGASSLTPAVAGIADCTKCEHTTKLVCTKCGQDKYLKIDGETISCVDAQGCGIGFFMITVDGVRKCIKCGDSTNSGIADCAECTAPGEGKTKLACTKCTGKYLKTAADGTTTCVEQNECTSDSFPVENTSTGNKCVSCGDAQGAADTAGGIWKGVTGCAKCTKPATANSPATCSECASGFNLEGETCVSSGANRSTLSTGAIAGYRWP